MKKNLVYIFAALAALTVASCAKVDFAEPEAPASGDKLTITIALPDSETKTTLGEDGKSVTWAEGDSILVSDGTKTVSVKIPKSADGTKATEVEIDATAIDCSKDLYAVYPYSAYAGVSAGAVKVNIPQVQSGLFEEANICVAKAAAETYNFKFKNATAIMKFSLPVTDIETVSITGGDADTLAATLAVTYYKADTLLGVATVANTPIKSIKVNTLGLDGDYYVAVAPAVYSTALTLSALTLEGKSEKITSTKAHTLSVNDIAYLGEIGNNLSGQTLSGTGEEEDPYQISTASDIATLAAVVNGGLEYEGKYFKVMNNIDGVTTPVGTYDGVDYFFKGIVDGNSKTITLAMGGDECKDNYLGLFGELGAGAQVKNLTIDGFIKTTGYYCGALAGTISGASAGVTVTNVVNKATVNAGSYSAGIFGYADGKVAVENCSNEADVTGANVMGGIAGQLNGGNIAIKNCVNKANVSGTYNVAGIAGYVYGATIEECTNDASATITGTDAKSDGFYKMNQGGSGWMWGNWNTAWAGGTPYNLNNSIRGIGGIAGYGQNAKFLRDTNNGVVNGVDKVAGILGSSYGSYTNGCTNNGAVTASNSMAGGIFGWAYTVHSADGDTNNGTIKATYIVGGLYGFLNCLGYSSSSSQSTIKNGKNNGAVIADKYALHRDGNLYYNVSMAGGVFGLLAPCGRSSAARGLYYITDCSNAGTVTATGNAVGGVVGMQLAKNYALTSNFLNVSNSGTVTGNSFVGGIFGQAYANLSGHYKTFMKNIFNTGKIVATAEGDATLYAGGIIGGATFNKTGGNSGYGSHLYNAYNTGDVTYGSAENTKPYIGGICGSYCLGTVQNVYNTGYVGLSGFDDPAEGAANSTGSVFGYIGYYYSANYLYYDGGTCARACGASSAAVGTSVSEVDSEGLLMTPVTFDEKEYDAVYNVLNAYATKNSLYGWAEGPVFVK